MLRMIHLTLVSCADGTPDEEIIRVTLQTRYKTDAKLETELESQFEPTAEADIAVQLAKQIVGSMTDLAKQPEFENALREKIVSLKVTDPHRVQIWK